MVTYDFTHSFQLAEICGCKFKIRPEELLDKTVFKGVLSICDLWIWVLELVSMAHDRIHEREKMTTNILSHIMGSFSLEVVLNDTLKVENMLKQIKSHVLRRV